MKKQKVICVGLSKTGTTSISAALEMLGWKTGHFILDPIRYDHFDALSDAPVCFEYRALDIRYPKSKFILTTRSEASYLKSAKKHFRPRVRRELAQIRRRYYGSIRFKRAGHLLTFRDHKREVIEYFSHYDRLDDLLVIDLCDRKVSDAAKWAKLCEFLEVPVPDVPFPWKNKTKAGVPDSRET